MNEVAIVNGSARLFDFIERAARDPEFDVQKFESLLRMQREMQQEQRLIAFNEAMAAAQAEMQPVAATTINTFIGNKYAKLEKIDEDIRPIYTHWGFNLRFGSAASPREGWMRIVCTVSHRAGYYEVHHLDAPPDKSGTAGKISKTEVQAVGSTVTYLRRYLTCMVFNIVVGGVTVHDDDGEGTRDIDRWTRFAKRVEDVLAANGKTTRDIKAIRDRKTVADALTKDERDGGAPLRIKRDIEALFTAAYQRLAPPDEPPPAGASEEETWDLLAALKEKAKRLDLIGLAELSSSAEWRSRVLQLLPTEQEELNDYLEQRRIELRNR